MNNYRCTKCKRDGTVLEHDCECGGFITVVPTRFRHRCPRCHRRHTCEVRSMLPMGDDRRFDHDFTMHRVFCRYTGQYGTWLDVGTTTQIQRTTVSRIRRKQ